MITFPEVLLCAFYLIYFKDKRINHICKIDYWKKTGIVSSFSVY